MPNPVRIVESNRRTSGWLRITLLSVPLTIALLTLFAACGANDPAAGDGTTTNVVTPSCATPNSGCDCDEPGRVAECGEVSHKSGDYVACSMGKRTCIGGKWGACIGEYDVTTRRFAAAGGTGTLALGPSGPCGTPAGGPANPCDPYCNGFVDTPVGLILEGGLVISDGGITISPEAGDAGDSGGPATPFSSTSNGTTSCGGATNIVAGACAPPGLTQCQQDFRCETTSNTCVWNGGPGYYDPTAGGIDLTVGTPCGPNGSISSTVPVCNRGSVLAPSGAPIVLQQTNAQPNGCTSFTATTTYNFTLGGDLLPGQCTSFIVGNSPGNKFITVNAGTQPGQPVAEGPGRCANNSAGWKTDGAPGCADCGSCNTIVRGRVFDPSGATPTVNANNVGLPNVRVFQPSGGLTPLPDNPAAGPPPCDTCASVASPEVTADLSKFDGAFQLTNFAPGPNRKLVVQTGRWRRQIDIGTVAACSTVNLTPGLVRLPKNRTDGFGSVADIPKTAIVLGERETIECMLRRVGISDSEFAPGTSAAVAQRFHIYRSNGPTMSPTAAPSGTALFQAGGRMGAYSAVIGNCDSGGIWQAATKTPAGTSDHDRMQQYANAGGRLFGDHWFIDALLTNGKAPWTSNTIATWDGAWADIQGLSKAKVPNGTAPQQLMYRFLEVNGAMTTYLPPFVALNQPRWQMYNAGSNAIEYLRGQDSWTSSPPDEWVATPGGNHAMSITFETPLGAAPAAQCGRFVANAMHVSQTRQPVTVTDNTHRFPNFCTGYPNPGPALTAEELALEYQFFQLTACAISPPPPVVVVPPPIILPVVNYQRDYLAVCGAGERVKWGPFYWQAVVPPTASIVFNAATASTLAALPASPAAAPPTTAAIATASTTTIPLTAWDCNGCPGGPVTVDSQLKTQTGKPSAEYLRVYMQFKPDVSQTLPPTLLSWRQIYDCVPAE